MKQKGAVLFTSMIVLIMLAGLSSVHLSTILTQEKATFNQMQSYNAEQCAEKGLADGIQSVMQCNFIREFTHEDEMCNYVYTIEDYNIESFYKLTATGTVLNKFSNTQQIVFSFDTKEFNPNNGWGNGDQDAPGNSLNNNNAENNTNGKSAPKGIQKKQEKDKNNNSCKKVSIDLIYWTEL